MSRLPILTPRFLRARAALRLPPGSDVGIVVAGVIRVLAEVGRHPSDVRAAIPPTGEAFVRRVPGRNLWIWYREREDKLLVLAITSSPPIPLDE